ncbi:MAG TPA: gamma-glutamyltransferase, partial [Pedococcus sp.]|nr:gamma-glutamyltransferase [Pedococcus sp.]
MNNPRLAAGAATAAGAVLLALSGPAAAQPTVQGSAQSSTERGPVGYSLPKVPEMRGAGGAVSSVDPVASQVGINILKAGGNAADAAVATAAALGVTEPYSTGIGGGGFFVFYDARTGRVKTIDGRETAPKTFTQNAFREPNGTPMDFTKAVNSGLS